MAVNSGVTQMQLFAVEAENKIKQCRWEDAVDDLVKIKKMLAKINDEFANKAIRK